MKLKKIKILTALAKALNVSPYSLFYYQVGIFKYQSLAASGEEMFIKKIVSSLLSNVKTPVFFDVGANEGNYTQFFQENLSNADIHCFEPNKRSFDILNSRKNITGVNLGLSDSSGIVAFYQDHATEHQTLSSMYPDFVEKYTSNFDKVEIETTTMQDYCKSNQIDHVHFLKIDTEGNEFKVLVGGSDMLNHIDIIQFEFNTGHVHSRVFLRDFYTLLNDFDIFRLDTHQLIDISTYNERNELFAFQNIAAISKRITASTNWKKNQSTWVKKI